MIVKPLTEHLLEFLSLKGGSSESTLVKMPNFWKSHASAQFQYMALYHSKTQCHAIMDEQGKNKEAVFF